jgi:predicted MFS family arabinose efflux permease
LTAESVPARGPIRYRNYRHLVLANGMSSLGSGIQAVAVGYLAFELTHSASALGLLAFLALAPAAVLSEAGGAVAVALGPRRVGIAMYVLRALPWATIAAIDALGNVTFVDLVIATAVGGILGAFSGVTVPDLIPTTVPEDVRDRAIALEGVFGNLARLVGPLLGGALFAALGSLPCFAANAASYLPVAAALYWTSPSPEFVKSRIERRSAPPVRLRGVLKRRDLRYLFVTVVVFSAFARSLQWLMPVVARHYSVSSRLLGEMLATMAAGALVASVGLPQLERRDLSKHHVTALAMTGAGVCMLLVAALPPLPVTLVALASLSMFLGVISAVVLSWVQLDATSPRLKSRMVGLYFAVAAGSLALGGLGLGAAINHLGLTGALGAYGGLVAAVGIWQLVSDSPLKGTRPQT